MTDRKLILKFLSDNLTLQEKNIFEQKLKTDIDFKTEYEKLNSSLLEMKECKNISADENYFINLSLTLHNKYGNKERRIFKPVLTLASTFAIAFIVILLVGQNPDHQITNSKISISDLTEQEINYLVEISPEELSNEKIIYKKLNENLSSLLTTELEINNESITWIYEDVESIASNISVAEADQIYNELINKDFFQ
ncbi:MAG: hypothetical protein IPH11_18205 [Ignavibacteriales bacterium]|nr:hypothetical protein [Ignavibacteriales bacterium]